MDKPVYILNHNNYYIVIALHVFVSRCSRIVGHALAKVKIKYTVYYKIVIKVIYQATVFQIAYFIIYFIEINLLMQKYTNLEP